MQIDAFTTGLRYLIKVRGDMSQKELEAGHPPRNRVRGMGSSR